MVQTVQEKGNIRSVGLFSKSRTVASSNLTITLPFQPDGVNDCAALCTNVDVDTYHCLPSDSLVGCINSSTNWPLKSFVAKCSLHHKTESKHLI